MSHGLVSMGNFRVTRTLVNGEHKSSSIRTIMPEEMIEGDIGSFRNRRFRALEIVNEWNRMSVASNIKKGVWIYHLLDGEYDG